MEGSTKIQTKDFNKAAVLQLTIQKALIPGRQIPMFQPESNVRVHAALQGRSEALRCHIGGTLVMWWSKGKLQHC